MLLPHALCYLLVCTPTSQATRHEMRVVSDIAGRPAAQGDWLVQATGAEAEVVVAGDGSALALTNGLVRRELRLKPNGATVALEDLVSGATLLRGVRPEARVVIDGVTLDVGGLVGQRNHAFLSDGWVDELRADPTSMQLESIQLLPVEARLDWKRVRHCAPDAVWPPAGVHLRMDYRLPELDDVQRRQLLLGDESGSSGLGRAQQFDVDIDTLSFEELERGWRTHSSAAHERCSVSNEGKVGELLAPENCAAFLERELEPGVRVVEATLDCGTDQGKTWGPGLALVFGGRAVKLNLRAGGGYDGVGRLGAWDGSREHPSFGGRMKLDLEQPWTLRMTLRGREVLCDARPEGGAGEASGWRRFGTLELPADLGEPTAVRAGKLDTRGGASDFGTPGELGRSRVLRVAAWGDVDAAGSRELSRRYEALRTLTVSVHYELYDGVPVLSKWVEVRNAGSEAVTIDRLTVETLAVVEHGSQVEAREGVPIAEPRCLHVETDFAFGGMRHHNANRHVVHWRTDPAYLTQVNYLRETPCLLVVEPTYGPAQDLEPGASFESFRAFELVQDSTERERRGLAQRRMYRTLAPWVTENPLMMHVRQADEETVRRAIEQCAETGFEELILSFGSGFQIENEDPEYIAGWASIAEHARTRGVGIGGYSLLSSRRIGGGNDVVSPPGERPTHGSCPALTSEWGLAYYAKLRRFFEQTSFTNFEHDGPYPGDVDVTPRPPLQKGIEDSRWVQGHIANEFYAWLRGRGVYTNAPDYYYLAGTNKCGMGYREVNWSLPRAEQVLHTRQNIFDGTWEKTPSMGWMFVPLTQYHGGGAAATVEPLDEHRSHYGAMLASNLGLGVQACYRGPRLFDTDRTRELVQGWVRWYKQHRDILESDVVHGRRADGRNIDWMLHVNPRLEEQGMLVAFNPLDRELTQTLDVDLYYTGLTDRALATVSAVPADAPGAVSSLVVEHQLERDYGVAVELTIPAGGVGWVVFRAL